MDARIKQCNRKWSCVSVENYTRTEHALLEQRQGRSQLRVIIPRQGGLGLLLLRLLRDSRGGSASSLLHAPVRSSAWRGGVREQSWTWWDTGNDPIASDGGKKMGLWGEPWLGAAPTSGQGWRRPSQKQLPLLLLAAGRGRYQRCAATGRKPSVTQWCSRLSACREAGAEKFAGESMEKCEGCLPVSWFYFGRTCCARYPPIWN